MIIEQKNRFYVEKIVWSFFAVLFLFACSQFLLFRQWGLDDGYIVFRIAHNLISGLGWHFNPEEAVNPSTSVMNTLLIAILGKIIHNIPIAGHLVSGFAIFGSSCLLFLILRSSSSIVALCSGLGLTFLLAHEFIWGLETALFVFLIFLFLYCEQHNYFSWWILGLLALTRPDGLLLVGLKTFKEWKKERTFPWNGISIVFFILLPWMVYSFYNFQQFFPGTFAKKMWQGQSGYWGGGISIYARDLFHYLNSSSGLYKCFLSMSFFGFYAIIRDRHPLIFLLAFCFIQQGAYVYFNVPGYPWYFAILEVTCLTSTCYFVCHCVKRNDRLFFLENSRVIRATIAIAVMFSFYSIYDSFQHPRLSPIYETYVDGISIIDRQFPEGALATVEVGAIGFHTNRKIIDLTSLTSANPEYLTAANLDSFFKEIPSLVILHNPVWPFEKALVNDYRFKKAYQKQGSFVGRVYTLDYFTIKEEWRDTQALQLAANQDAMHSTPFFEKLDPLRFPILKSCSSSTCKSCCLEFVNHGFAKSIKIFSVRNLWLSFEGWALDPDFPHKISDEIYISLVNEKTGVAYGLQAVRSLRQSPLEIRLGRVKNHQLINCGFTLEGNVSKIPQGLYQVCILQKREDGYFSYLSNLKIELFPFEISARDFL